MCTLFWPKRFGYLFNCEISTTRGTEVEAMMLKVPSPAIGSVSSRSRPMCFYS